MEPYFGQIKAFPFNIKPEGWILCDGRLLQISENPDLFAFLGTNFGGDGETTFALPDLRGAESDRYIRCSYYISLKGEKR